MSNEALGKYHQIHYDRSDRDIPKDDEILRLYQLTEPGDYEPDVELAWTVVQGKINRKRNSLWMKIAASVIILLTAGWLIYFNYPVESVYLTQVAEYGKLEITLPDNSVVTLNENSSISYPPRFEEKRSVELRGEGFFAVQKGELPFRVYTGQSVTTVLGTSFNIRQHDDVVSVFVEEGLVAFGTDIQNIQILAGQSGTMSFHDNSLLIDRDPDPNVLAWINNRFVFDQTKMSDAITTLEKHFGKTISMSGKHIGNCSVTGTFDSQDLEEILESICVVLDLTLETRKNQYILKGKGC